MSRARVTRKLTIALFAAATLLGGCIFSPAPAPPTPPPPPRPIDSPEALVEALSNAYQTRRFDRIEGLFHDDYQFVLHPNPDDPSQPINWGRTEELRIHKRMFEPQNIAPSDPPLDPNLWLVSVTINLSGTTFEERTEFYSSATNPEGLEPTTWKALGADYDTSVLFETQGETDYLVTGRAWFVVVQDLTKTPGETGSFLLYRWQDLGDRTAKPSRGPAT